MEGPFYVLQNEAAIDATKGGIAINNNIEVVGETGDIIPGLYAVGDLSNQVIYGTIYPTCGGFTGYGVFSGRRAGVNAAAYVDANK